MVITLPKIGAVNFRDDLTPEQFQTQLEALSKKYDFEIPQAELTTGEMAGRAFERGKKRLSTTFGDLLPAMVGDVLGFDEFAKQQMDEAAATEEEIQTYYAPQYQSYKDIEGIGSALGFGLETVVEQIPNIITSLVPGVGAGAIAGRTALAATAKTLTAQAAERGLAGKAAEEFITKGLQAAAPSIASRVGAAQGAGVFLGSYAQNAPEIFQNIYEETGSFEAPTALLFGSVSAALDSVLPATLARQLTGPARIGVVEKILEKSGMDRGVLRSTTAGVFQGVGTEGLTEGAQEAISITAERFIDENPDVFGSKEWERILESSIRGAVAGSAFGGAGGSIESLRAGAERKRQMAEALEKRGERLEAARLRKELEGIESEIKQIELANPQQTLPGIDTAVASSIYQPQDIAAKATKDAKDSLTGQQLSLFDSEGKLTKAAEKAATKDEKKAANAAREEAKRAAAQLKEDQAKLKKFLGAKQATLPGFSEEEVQALQVQTREQQAAQAEAGQGDLFGGMPPPPPPPTEAPAPSTVIGSDKDALKTFGKQFGIGHTARILKPDGPLAGKDISKPEDAAEVRRVLEAYAAGNPAAGAAAKIEEYLKRPEFQVAATEVVSGEPTTEFIDGTAEPSVSATTSERVGEGPTEGAGAPVVGGVEASELSTTLPDVGEGVVETSVEETVVTPTVDETVTETTVEETTPELDVVKEADARATDFIRKAVADAFETVGLSPTEVQLEDFANTDAYNYIRLPQLINELFRLKDVLATPDEQVTKKDKEKRKKDQADLKTLEKTINGIAGTDFLKQLNAVPPSKREAVFNEMNREARAQVIDVVQSDTDFQQRMLERQEAGRVRPGQTSFERKPKKSKKPKADKEVQEFLQRETDVTDEELDAFNQAYYEKTGETLFLPEHRGSDLNDAGRALVEAGDLKGVIDNLKDGTQNKDVQRILAKVKSLNLKTKIVVGNPEGPLSLEDRDYNVGYHQGNLGYGRDTTLGKMAGGRSTGHFGTGVYFVSKAPTPESGSLFDTRADRPVKTVDFSEFNLLVPYMDFEAEDLHKALRFANDLVDAKFDFEDLDAPSPTYDTKYKTLGRAIETAVDDIRRAANSFRSRSKLKSGKVDFSKDEVRKAFIDGVKEAKSLIDQYRFKSDYVDSASTRVIKNLGFDGIDVRHLKQFDNTTYGSVIYAEQLSPDVDKLYAGNKAGSYDPRTDTITVNPDVGLNEHTILHELMHAAVSHVLRNRNLPVTRELGNFFEQIKNQLGDAYGGQDLQEFAAELVSNPEFQALLKTIKAPKSESLFKRIMQTLAQFFGFGKGTNAYKRGLELVNRAIDISGDVAPSPSDLLFLGTPNGMSRGLKAVGMVGQSMPQLTERLAENTRNYISNMPGGVKSVAMGLLRLDNINEIYGKELPSLQKLIDALEQRNGTQEQRIKVINENYKRFTEVANKHPKDMERMNDMAYEARLAQVDPIDPNFKPTAAQQADYNKIKQIYNSLNPEVQRVYKDIRKDYDDAINEYENILLNSVEDPSVRQKLKAEYEARKRQVAYIPFLRQGDFWVEYDENGQRAAQAFQSERERQMFISTQLKGKQHKTYRNINEATFSQGSLPPGSFIVGVMNQLNKQGATDQLKNSVYQSYLALFPAESLAKNFMKADNVRGMERDIVRGYGETMIKWARKLSASKYNPEIDRALRAIALEGEAAEQAQTGSGAYVAAQNVVDQASFLHNPTYGKLVSAATTFSYFNYIAGNISSALLNLATLPMFSWSVLGARYGFDKAASALFNSSRVMINYIFNDQVPVQYRRLFDELTNHAQLEHTLAREVLEGRRQTTGDFIGLKARVMDGLSIPFNKTEVLNRGATAIAAFDLARKSGMNEADAIRYAINTTKQINTSGLSATAPRYMQHPAGRVFFTFKSFIWNSAFVVARAFHQAFKGESPQIQREARRQLLGIYGMTMAFAGIKGLPFMGAASTLSTMINALFGDDDEPFDFDAEMRAFFGDLLYKGGVNYATNLEIANRTGVANDLIFRDDPRSVAEHGYVLTAMSQLFGPVGSYALGAGRGAELIAQGEVARGIESLVPSFIRNGMKGMRFMTDGATTLKGEPIVEDVSAYNALMQMIGFGPADLSAAYEEISMKKQYERDVLTRRAQLLNKYDMAKKSGDLDLEAEVRADIESFNARRKDPNARITQDTLNRSQRARKAYEENTINGVRFNKSLLSEVDDLFGEE
jgi:hypothetical protein